MTSEAMQTLMLEPLGDSDRTGIRPADDLRGRDTYDRDGQKIGTVDDLIVDRQERRVRMIKVASVGFLGMGERGYLIPVDAIAEVNDDAVHLNQSRDRIAGGPVYQPQLSRDTAFYDGVYDYYGYAPYWGAGHRSALIPHRAPRRARAG